MKWIRSNFVLKLAAFLLALVVGTGGFWASTFILYQWDTLWLSSGYYDSVDYHADLYNRLNQLQEMARLLQVKEWDGSLPYLDQRRLDTLEESLSPERTNFRYTIRRNEGGTLISSNLEGAATLDGSVHTVEQSEMSVGNDSPTEADYMVWNGEERYYLVYVTLPDGTKQLFTPENANEAYQYGYTFNGIEWDYDSDLDSRVNRAMLALEYGVTDPLTVQDEFWTGSQDYFQYASYLPALAVLALVLDLVGVLLVIFLCRTAGWRKGENRPVQGWFDRIPLDLLAVGEFFAVALLLNAGDVMAYGLNVSHMAPDMVAGLGMVTAAILACLLAFCLTVAVRIKTRTLWRCTLVWMLCRLIARGCRAAARSWPFTWRVVALFLLYLLGTILTGLTIFLIPFYQGAVLYAICRWTIQWKKVRAGTGEILGGKLDHQIDTAHMYPDLASHAQQLNDLGQAIGSAVEERIQSERFKAELITNVSHDLKTPLTSIINYVDLLKKQGLDSPSAPEYLDVLDRKSQRLKKLTEDLVEASKASTGTLPVHAEPLGMVQLVQQALGEFEEKFAQNALKPVPSFPEGEVWVRADGRHLWRVVDNLLSNCNKYALEGTRVYLQLLKEGQNAVFSVKNISRDPLNIPPEQLMERFVRGDSSRTTDGSGLGLSIARSLTELQGGQFGLSIDGDLFKATVTFPLAPPPEEALQPLPPAN
nr:HAMP domain-containing sensor histidine kinase [uncultured Flavonifractor sp.]